MSLLGRLSDGAAAVRAVSGAGGGARAGGARWPRARRAGLGHRRVRRAPAAPAGVPVKVLTPRRPRPVGRPARPTRPFRATATSVAVGRVRERRLVRAADGRGRRRAPWPWSRGRRCGCSPCPAGRRPPRLARRRVAGDGGGAAARAGGGAGRLGGGVPARRVGPAAGRVRVGLDYASFAQAYGGNFGTRLQLVKLPACALTTPQVAACRRQTPLGSVQDYRRSDGLSGGRPGRATAGDGDVLRSGKPTRRGVAGGGWWSAATSIDRRGRRRGRDLPGERS